MGKRKRIATGRFTAYESLSNRQLLNVVDRMTHIQRTNLIAYCDDRYDNHDDMSFRDRIVYDRALSHTNGTASLK